MSTTAYAELLKHPKWQEKRLRVLEGAGFRCVRCFNAERSLHAHHKVYLKGHKPWEYEDALLECLCERCHDQAHTERAELEYMITTQPTASVPRLTDAIYGAIVNDATDPALPQRVRDAFRALGLALAGSDPAALTTAHNRMQDLIDEYRDLRRGPGGVA